MCDIKYLENENNNKIYYTQDEKGFCYKDENGNKKYFKTDNKGFYYEKKIKNSYSKYKPDKYQRNRY